MVACGRYNISGNYVATMISCGRWSFTRERTFACHQEYIQGQPGSKPDSLEPSARLAYLKASQTNSELDLSKLKREIEDRINAKHN
jgi:hypothetical protein